MSLDDRSRRIDRAKPVHVWKQVADDIQNDIETGRLASGAKLPNEIELAAQYGVARLTARRAIAELVSTGFLIVLRGRGTYVQSR